MLHKAHSLCDEEEGQKDEEVKLFIIDSYVFDKPDNNTQAENTTETLIFPMSEVLQIA